MRVRVNKTNAVRLLDKANISYELISYEVYEDDLTALHVAEELGKKIEQIFKTLVLQGDKNNFFVCIIPGNHEIDLKKAAKVSGNKKADLIPLKDLFPVTGYVRGGCSPIAMKKEFPTFIHSGCLEFDKIYISAGMRGLQIKIATEDLLRYTKAIVAFLV